MATSGHVEPRAGSWMGFCPLAQSLCLGSIMGDLKAPVPWPTLSLLSSHTFSRPSSFKLMMSRSKSVRKPLVLLKTIRPVNPSH